MKKMKAYQILLTAAFAGLLWSGCSQEKEFADDVADGDEARFTADIEAATRTAGGGDEWLATDRVGIFMLTAGGSLSTAANVLADNAQYAATPGSPATTATFAPASADETIYYPQSGEVDFVAYYPYGASGMGAGQVTDDYKYNVSVAGQTSEAAQNALDALYARTTGIAKTKTAVGLTFGHVLSKVTLNITLGEGFTALTGADITAVMFSGMPLTAELDLQDGTLTTDDAGDFPALKAASASVGAAATFTALLVPQTQTLGGGWAYTGRTALFTVDGQPYTWQIGNDEEFLPGQHYVYPVTVNKTGVTVGAPTIADWTTHDNDTGVAEQVRIVPEANCYMVEPNGAPILIPVSQANRVLTADGLGAQTTGLGGVEAGNYTVELVWSDTPVGAGGVISDMFAHKIGGKGYVYVEPGVAGNAVVAIRDKTSGAIKWSWHIWVTEPVTVTTNPFGGFRWMDKNLGAGGAGSWQSDGKNGLYYQWGRKDAFPGSNGTNNNQTYYTPEYGTIDNPPTGSYTELPQLTQNPLNFATNYNTYYGSLNVSDANNDSWGGVSDAKTIYDPCPPGWRVPKNGDWTTDGWAAASNGLSNDAFGGFYPLAGYRNHSQAALSNVGGYGYYWSATQSTGNTTTSFHLYLYNGTVYPSNGATRASGLSVRCRTEVSDTPKPMTVVEEANSYMVKPNGEGILIPVSQANKAADPSHNLGAATQIDGETVLGGVEVGNFTVELVWGDTPVGAGGVIKEMLAYGEYVYVEPGIAGNAVIAIRDKATAKIKWSWHIWVTEPVTSTADFLGRPWMDRNLGAKSNDPAQWAKTLGLYYQWGRKDAFPGSDGTYNNQTYYTPAYPGGTTANPPTGSYTELPQLTQNPLNFATNWGTYCGSLNVSDANNDSWGGVTDAKTIYDPCPPGWRVPKNGEWTADDWSTASNGLNNPLGGFYPLAGSRFNQAALEYVGNIGYYWSVTQSTSTASYSLCLYPPSSGMAITSARASGFSVRCRGEW